MRGPTRRQLQVLELLDTQPQPSVRELAGALGVTSTSTVAGYLAQCERKGYVRRPRYARRSIEVLPAGRAVLARRRP